MKYILTLLTIFLFSTLIMAQIPSISEGQAKAELERRGISEVEFRERLKKEGIDLDNITPEQLPTLEPKIQKILADLEAEKKKNAVKDAEEVKEAVEEQVEEVIETKAKEEAVENVKDIKEAVEDGASLEEAISEELVEETKESLPPSRIYGQQIFRDQSLKIFRSTTDVTPPNSYILGPGDKVNINIWGPSTADFTLEINDAGYIYSKGDLPVRIQLKGINYGKAKKLIESRLHQYYRFRSGEIAVTLQTARTLNINIFGEVLNNGSFTISAQNTAFNALIAAGGPSDLGTLRNIQLIRDGQKKNLDVYEFLLDPVKQFDYFLENNDIIYIPIAEKVVSITGAVKRPLRYELKSSENLRQLVKYAGGLAPNAYQENLQIRRIENNEEVIIDVNLAAVLRGGSDVKLQNGDQITVRTVPNKFESFVQVQGAVDLPGTYDFNPRMKVGDLLKKGILSNKARTDIAYILRKNLNGTFRTIFVNIDSVVSYPYSTANITLKPEDKLTINRLSEIVDNASISIGGAVRNPLPSHPYDFEKNITVSQAITLAGGLKQDATNIAYIKRTDPTNPRLSSYIKVDVVKATKNPKSKEDIILEPFDALSIYSITRTTEKYNVQVIGAVREPSTLDFDSEGMRVSDAIYLSGGLVETATDFAFIERTDITNPKLKEYLKVDLKTAVDNPNSAANIVLLPEDVIQVMSVTEFENVSTVQVGGAVRNPLEVQYDESLKIEDVLTRAGGLTFSAASNKIDVYRVIIQENQPTQTIAATLEVNEDYEVINGGNFELQPFDKVIVRNVPDFELQQMVRIDGEVKYPGLYALIDKNERISSLIRRAGGITAEAFPEGTQLYRLQNNTGEIITRLDKILKGNNKFDYVLKTGDIIKIPKSKDIVTIKFIATKAAELYPEKVLTNNQVSVAYSPGRKAKWYVRNYAGGVDRDNRGRNRLITVEMANKRLSKRKLTGNAKVGKGAVIKVGQKKIKPEKQKEKKEKEPFDWNEFAKQTIGITVSVLQLVLLLNNLN